MSVSEYNKAYYARNRDKMLAQCRANYLKNPSVMKARVKSWAKANPEKARDIGRASVKRRRERNPSVKIAGLTRTRMYQALKGAHKSAKTTALIGCSMDELKLHIQSQFRLGMTWENYGPIWHIDHIKPCSSFDLTNPQEQLKCFNYTNLQPLFAFENISKGNRIAA